MGPKFTLQSVLDFRHSRVEALEMDFAKLNEARRQGLTMQAECQQALAKQQRSRSEDQSHPQCAGNHVGGAMVIDAQTGNDP